MKDNEERIVVQEGMEGFVCCGDTDHREYRPPRAGEFYVASGSHVFQACIDFDAPYYIVVPDEEPPLFHVEVEYKIEVLGVELPVEDLLDLRDALNLIPFDKIASAAD